MKASERNIVASIPYKLGSSLEENSVDLELRQECTPWLYQYNSYRYSEIYLFGKAFEAVCSLWFSRGVLSTIEYKFHKQYFELFKEEINKELPMGKELSIEPHRGALEVYINKVAISLVEVNEDMFLLRLSKNPSLPRI